MTPTIYITVPVEVKPEKEGWYYLTNAHGVDGGGIFPMQKYFDGKVWQFIGDINVTHYLRPATRAELINLLREDLEKAMGEVWQDGWEKKDEEEEARVKYGYRKGIVPDRSTSINNAIQKLIGG